MKLLLDTQIALWSVAGDAKLNKRASAMIANPDNELWVSVVSIWEIAIKHPLQRGSINDMPIPGRVAARLFDDTGFAILAVTSAHAAAIDDLPPLHGDPFDRMLIAQAQAEGMRLLTADQRLDAYGVPVLLA